MEEEVSSPSLTVFKSCNNADDSKAGSITIN